MRRASMSLLILVTALVAASAADAASGNGIAFRVDLIPCFPSGERDAQGEASWVQKREGTTETAKVKIKISGIPERAGEELEVVVHFIEGEVDRPFVVGSVYVGPSGRGSTKATPARVDLDGSEEMHVVVGGESPLFVSDRDDCRPD